jgi:RNA polymerase sigma-70 factor (ECF subfamily)
MVGFTAAFRAQLADRPFGAELETALAAAFETAHAAWPTLAIADGAFGAHLATLVRDEDAPAATLGQLAIGDIYLSLACAGGDPAALAILDREYFTELRPTLSRIGLAGAAIDEALQIMREELLTVRPEAPPRILHYGGRGQLRGWLRSVAARTGLRLVKHPERHDELDETRHAPIAGDLELEYMKKTYGEVFRRAFAAALAALPADDRLLLKQRFRHHLTVEELGALHAVHAGTISRWVAAARERLIKATRAEMMRQLGVGRADVSSIMRLIDSEIEITLSTQHDVA